MTKTEILMGFDVKKFDLKRLDVKFDSDINGLYAYDIDNVFINICSDEFKDCKTELQHIKLFTYVLVHEFVHSEIYKETGLISNDKEEEIVLILDGRGEINNSDKKM